MFALAKDAMAAKFRGGASPVEDREFRENSHQRVSRRAAVLMAGLLVVLSGVISQAPPASASAQPLIFFTLGSTVATVTGESSSSVWANDGQSGNATGMASDGTYIYWAKGANVWRRPIDASSSPSQVVQAGSVGSGSFSIRAIDLDSDHIYMLGVDSGGVFHVARATKAGVLDAGWRWTTSNLVTAPVTLEGQGLSVGPGSVFVTHTVVDASGRVGKVWKASKDPDGSSSAPVDVEEWIVGTRGVDPVVLGETPDQALPLTNDGTNLYASFPDFTDIRWRAMSSSGSVGVFDLFDNRVHQPYPALDMAFDSSTGDIIFAYQRQSLDPEDDPDNPTLPMVLLTIFGSVSPASPNNSPTDIFFYHLPLSDKIGGIVATSAPAATPTINTSPSARSAGVGDSVSFSVVASSSDAGVLSYQWRKDGSDIAGADESTLSISAVGLSDAGSYTVVVTNTLGASTATTTSAAAVLTITAPAITSVSPASGSPDGGDTVTITGTGFGAGATVTIGGSPCTSVTVVSPTSITCITPSGNVGSVDVTVTNTDAQSGSGVSVFSFVVAQNNTPAVTPEPSTTEAPTTTAAPVAPSSPTLVNETNQETLTQTPGSATALVNGEPVEVTVLSTADSAAAQTAPEDRTAEQIAELQEAAIEVVNRLSEIAGDETGITVVATDTGAELAGVFPDANVPIEDVIVVDIDTAATLFAARDADGTIIEVQPGAVLEVTPDGEVAVLAFGLPTGDEVELVVMSTPTLLGTFTVNSKGSVETQVNLPEGIGAGDHTLVVASPNVQASLGLKVADSRTADSLTSDAATLPSAGVNLDNSLAVLLFAIGGLLVLIGRRRRGLDTLGVHE